MTKFEITKFDLNELKGVVEYEDLDGETQEFEVAVESLSGLLERSEFTTDFNLTGREYDDILVLLVESVHEELNRIYGDDQNFL